MGVSLRLGLAGNHNMVSICQRILAFAEQHSKGGIVAVLCSHDPTTLSASMHAAMYDVGAYQDPDAAAKMQAKHNGT